MLKKIAKTFEYFLSSLSRFFSSIFFISAAGLVEQQMAVMLPFLVLSLIVSGHIGACVLWRFFLLTRTFEEEA